MNRRPLHALGLAAAGLLLLPAFFTQSTASAAHLEVTAAPIQTWTIVDGLPELPDPTDPPTADLSACGDLTAYDDVVYGTAGDDELIATNERQILVGLAGDDVLRGGNHDDCLLGGYGDDVLFGGNGRDILSGGAGADALDGGTGMDVLDAGGDDGDSCISQGAPDETVGCGPADLAAADATELTEPEPTEPQSTESESPESESTETGASGSNPKGTGSDADGPRSSGGKDAGTDDSAQAPPQEVGTVEEMADSGDALADSLSGE